MIQFKFLSLTYNANPDLALPPCLGAAPAQTGSPASSPLPVPTEIAHSPGRFGFHILITQLLFISIPLTHGWETHLSFVVPSIKQEMRQILGALDKTC